MPTIEGSGTGRSIYYAWADLVDLAVMEYLLSVGLSFEKASKGLKAIREKEQDYANPRIGKRLMLWWDEKKRSLELIEFDREQAIASLLI